MKQWESLHKPRKVFFWLIFEDWAATALEEKKSSLNPRGDEEPVH